LNIHPSGVLAALFGSYIRKQNNNKTEVFLCGPSSRRETVPVDCLSVGEASIPFSNVVKTLGVTLDAELSMEQHVSAVTSDL